MNEFTTLVSLLLHSPLIWVIVLGIFIKNFYSKVNDEGLMTEKEYYHDLHVKLQELYENKYGTKNKGKDKE